MSALQQDLLAAGQTITPKTWSWSVINSTLRGYSRIISSDSGSRLLVNNYDGTSMYYSNDYGASWTAKTSLVAATAFGGNTEFSRLVVGYDVARYLYTSLDYGSTWTISDSPTGDWLGCAFSSSAAYVLTGSFNSYIYTSSNNGVNWTQRAGAGARQWEDFAVGSNGQRMTAVVGGAGGYIYTSADYGVTWTERTSAGSRVWTGCCSNNNGDRKYAVAADGSLYESFDSGANWYSKSFGATFIQRVACSSNGDKIFVACAMSGSSANKVYMSENYGNVGTWVDTGLTTSYPIYDIACNTAGDRVVTAEYGGVVRLYKYA